MDLEVLRPIPNSECNQYQSQLSLFQEEFHQALQSYQSNDLQEKLGAEQHIIKLSFHQKVYSDGSRGESRTTPALNSEMKPPQEVTPPPPEGRTDESKDTTKDCSSSCSGIGSHRCSPVLSEDDHSETCRSLSSTSGVSGCAESLSCSSSVSNTPISSRPNSPNHVKFLEHVTFPPENIPQEEFLSGLGLITHARLKSKSESKKVERRRRTTANPKYNRNGFIDLSHLAKRNKKLEEINEELRSPKKEIVRTSQIKPEDPKLTCIICEQLDCNLTCETCCAKLHSDCIKVSGSRAPTPSRLPKCPDCITAANEARRYPELKTEEAFKFQQPLVPATPIIPVILKRKTSSSATREKGTSANDKSGPKGSKGKKAKVDKGSNSASVPESTKDGKGHASAKSSSASSSLPRDNNFTIKKGFLVDVHKTDLNSKNTLNSPFKTLTALTGRGLSGTKVKLTALNSATIAFPNGTTHTLKAAKKKSKINGVKATTLSVTGTDQLHASQYENKLLRGAKTSPQRANILSSSGNKGKGKGNTRLSNFNSDQEISVQQTILAMTAAAKSVMSSNANGRVLALCIPAQETSSSSNAVETEQTDGGSSSTGSNLSEPNDAQSSDDQSFPQTEMAENGVLEINCISAALEFS